jgi:hypothetical protein
MDANLRAYAWTHFVAAGLARNNSHTSAAKEADLALTEFDKRDFTDPADARAEEEREARTRDLEGQLEVVNKARQFDQVNELTGVLALPGETVVEVVERLVKAFDDK